MTGNTDSRRREPLFLLDESLASSVARTLALDGYEIRATTDVLRKQGTEDQEIIEWCRQNNAVWIHADNKAKIQHQQLLRTSGIRTLLIRRKGGAMAPGEQLRILSSVLPRLIDKYGEQPTTLHYRAFISGKALNPSLMVEQI